MRRPRFHIRTLLIAVAVAAVLLALLRLPGGILLALMSLMTPALAVVCWLMVRGRRRFAARCFGVSSFAANASVASLCVYLLSIGGVFLMMLVSFVTIPMILGFGIAWGSAATGRDATNRRSPLVAWPLIFVLAIAPMTMMYRYWPIRLVFLVSKPALDRLADRVASGHVLRRPEWAGLYRVVGSAIDPSTGNIGLIIDPSQGGRSGFVRLGPGSLAIHSSPLVNLNFDEPMGQRWFYQNED